MHSKKQDSRIPKKNNNRKFFNYAKYSGIAFQFAALIGLGFYGGSRLDKYLELQKPIFTAVFALLGVIIGIYFAIKDFIKKDE